MCCIWLTVEDDDVDDEEGEMKVKTIIRYVAFGSMMIFRSKKKSKSGAIFYPE